MIKIDNEATPETLLPRVERVLGLAGEKIALINREYDDAQGSPVFTRDGKYTTRGWTEWTEGFRYGIAALHFDGTGARSSLEFAREKTVNAMATHVSHIGVHDHGFNNLSTYGNLRRLMLEGRIDADDWERRFYELALKVSGAVQAARWSRRAGGHGHGYIYSFNGPHSLFVDTIRSCRILMVAHRLGHVLMAEGDKPISLLERALEHIRSTAEFNVYYGEGRDSYDLRGRTAHECVFNTNDGQFRCPNSQQGYTGFSTWTRGLSWAVCGFAEELEFLETLPEEELTELGGRRFWQELCLKAARATCDFYLEHTPVDGVPYWDTGAPNLHKLGEGYLDRPADPFNEHEPVDSTAAAITAQGLLRLGRYLIEHGQPEYGRRYFQAGLTVAGRLFSDDYLSTDGSHQGLLLHSIYHRPNGWDQVPAGGKTPANESSMWGDYHAMELAIYLQRLAQNGAYLTFFP